MFINAQKEFVTRPMEVVDLHYFLENAFTNKSITHVYGTYNDVEYSLYGASIESASGYNKIIISEDMQNFNTIFDTTHDDILIVYNTDTSKQYAMYWNHVLSDAINRIGEEMRPVMTKLMAACEELYVLGGSISDAAFESRDNNYSTINMYEFVTPVNQQEISQEDIVEDNVESNDSTESDNSTETPENSDSVDAIYDECDDCELN